MMDVILIDKTLRIHYKNEKNIKNVAFTCLLC